MPLETVRAIALAGEEMHELTVSIGREPAVRSVERGMSARSLPGLPRLEWFVEAALISGDFVIWWLELREEGDRLLVDASIALQHGEDQDTLYPHPVSTNSTANEFHASLVAAALWLRESSKRAIEEALEREGEGGTK